MANMLVMTQQGRRDSESIKHAVLVREGFASLAIILPPLWLLWHRAYGAALVTLLMGVAITSLSMLQEWQSGAFYLNFLLSFYVALDGNSWIRKAMENRGFEVIDVLPTGNRAEAEDALAALFTDTKSQKTFGRKAAESTMPQLPASASADAMIFSSQG